MSTARVDFTRSAAERIAATVRRVEQGDRDGQPLSFGRVVSEGRTIFRTARFTGSWTKNTSKTITLRNITSTPNTVVASNLFATLQGSTVTSVSYNCAIAREGTAWILIAAECA